MTNIKLYSYKLYVFVYIINSISIKELTIIKLYNASNNYFKYNSNN